MKYNDFENNMRNQLRNAQEPVDTDALINAIHSVDIRDRKGLIWFFGLGLLLISMPAYLVFANDNTVDVLAVDNFTVEDSKNIVQNVESNSIEKSISEVIVDQTDSKKLILDDAVIQNKISKIAIVETNIVKAVVDNNYSPYIIQESIPVQHITPIEKIVEVENVQKLVLSAVTIPGVSFDLLPVDLSVNTKSKANTVDCPSFSPIKWRFGFGVHVGAFLPMKTLAMVDGEPNDIFTDRDENEKSLEGLNGGIFVQMNHNKMPLYIKAGVDYSKLTEQLKIEVVTMEMDTTQGIISITESQNGDTLTVIRGDIITERTITTNSVSHYNFQMIDLPVALGYQFNLGAINLGLEAGIALNIMTKTEGKILNESDVINELADNEGFESRIGVSYFGKLVIEKPIGFGSVFLSMGYRFIPNDFSTTFISQKYNFAGANLGYRMSF